MSDPEISGMGSKPLPNVADGAIENGGHRRNENAATSIRDFTTGFEIRFFGHSDSTSHLEVSQ